MSEILRSAPSHKSHVLSPLLFALTSFYALLFAFVFRQYPYAEPGGFPVFYTAGKLARYDLRGLYSQHLQDMFHPGNLGTGYFFHLPYELLLLVPLSYLPQTFAYAVWTLLNLLCLFGVAAILRRHFPTFAMFTPFAFGPTLSLLLNGQDLGILALLVALAFDSFAKEKDLQAGAILALGLFKFPLVLPLVAILSFRHWRVLVGFIAFSVPLLLASALVVGTQGIRDYVALTHGTDAKEAPRILINLRGAIGVLFGPHTVLVIVLSVALAVLVAWMKSTRIPMFCIAVVVTELVSWHAHLYDALLILIPMGWMSESESRWLRNTPTALLLMTAAMLLDSAYCYLLGIFLCIVLSTLLVSQSSLDRSTTPGPQRSAG
jgi:hypothetical protein